MSIASDIQSPSPGGRIEFFEIDARSLGAGILRFTSAVTPAGYITWRGVPWIPASIKTEGFEKTVRSALPRPKLSISNVNLAIGIEAIANQDLRGATLTRYVTFEQFLDGASLADSAQTFLPDVFQFERKTAHNKKYLEWELIAPIDREQAMIPNRRMLATLCDRPYRTYQGGTFTYPTRARACPYTGTAYFDANGQSTDAAHDQCGRHLKDCKLRFGAQVAASGTASLSLVPPDQGTISGNASVPQIRMRNLEAVFDGTAAPRDLSQCAVKTDSGYVAFIGKQWASPLIISGFRLIPSTVGFLSGLADAGASLSVSLVGRASDGSFPSLGSWTVTDQNTALDFSTGIDTSAAHDWHVIQIGFARNDIPICVSQAQFFSSISVTPASRPLPFGGFPGVGRVTI